MAFCTHLLSIYISLFCLSLYNINGVDLDQWSRSEIADLAFSWQNCGPATDPIQIKTLNLSPDPIKTPGNITVGLTVAILSALPADIHASVTLEKKVGKFYVKVPCVDNVGSCNYGNVCKMWAEFCPKYFEKYGFPCACPIPANTYSVPDAIVDISKKVPSQATGEFKLTANIAGDSHNLGCFKLQFKLKD